MKVLAALPLAILRILVLLAPTAAHKATSITAFVPPSTSIPHHDHPPNSPSSPCASASRGGSSSAIVDKSHPKTDAGTALFRQAAAVGIVTAAMGHVYGLILDRTVKGVWSDVPAILAAGNFPLGPWYIVVTIAIGGFLMGLLSAKLKPTYIVAEFVSTLSGDYDAPSSKSIPKLMPALPNLLLLSLVTSTFGFSVGPEAPMVCAGALVGAAMSRRWSQTQHHTPDTSAKSAEHILTYAGASGALTAFMGIPLAGPIFVLELTSPSSGMASVADRALGPAAAASAAALLLIRGVLDPASPAGGHFSYGPSGALGGRAAVLTALACGCGGAALGTAFAAAVRTAKGALWRGGGGAPPGGDGGRAPSLLLSREVAVKTAVGVAVGLLSALYPATMFWGEGSLQCAVDAQRTPLAATRHGLPAILAGAARVGADAPYPTPRAAAEVGCAKLLSIALACAGGFPGGIIFPLFFAAAPLAHAAAGAVGGGAAPVAVMSLMASTQASVTRTPLATVLMLALSASSSGTDVSTMLPSVMLSSYIGVWLSRYLSEESYFAYSK